MAKVYLLVFYLMICLLACVENTPITYYISSEGNDNNAGTSPENPWKSIGKLNDLELKPGDKVLFNRGEKFEGAFKITSSGETGKPIHISSYGDGPLPQLSNPNWDTLFDGNVIRVEGQYIVIEKLHFVDGPAHPYSADNANNGNIYDMGAVNFSPTSAHCSFQFCEVENYPIGVQSQGINNKIYQNYLHDCNIIMCPPKWGPIAIFVGGRKNEISYNYIKNYKGGGSGGFDGGAIEVDRMYFHGYGYGADSVDIHHNISIENAGFAEPEARADNNGHQYLSIRQNFSHDYKWFIEFLNINHCNVSENISIRTLPKKSDNDGILRLHGSKFSFEKNVFISGLGRQTFRPEDSLMVARSEGNIFFSSDGSSQEPVGISLSPSDEVITDKDKLSSLFGKNDELQIPEPDGKGKVSTLIPTSEKFKLEAFSITLPQ